MMILIFLLTLSSFLSLSAQENQEGFTDRSQVNEEVLLPRLSGLVFYDRKNCVNLDGDLYLEGIKLANICIPDQKCFEKKMRAFLGKKVTPSSLQKLKNTIIDHYKCNFYPLIVVTTPSEQDVTTGVLRILILQGKLGKLQACGAKYFSNEKIACQIRTKPGQVIDFYCMMQDLNWINRNSFLDTDIIYSPGDELGYTDITLQTCDRKPIRVYGGYENTGNIVAGNSRYYAGVDFGNIFNLDHELRYLVVMSPNTSKWFAHTGTYTAPLRWRHVAELYGSYTRALPNEGEDIDLKGNGWQVAGRYIVPINFYSFESEAFLGYKFQRTNNFLAFASNEVFNEYFDISQFILGYEIKKSYFCGQTAFGVKLFMSPGGMTAFNKTKIFEVQRPGAQANYVYGVAFFDQFLQFYDGYSWVLNTKFQYSSTKLLPIEEFSLGGFYTIRGYDENEVIGDNGILIKNEVRTPLWCFIKKQKASLQALAFIDFGVIADADQNIISQNSTVLASIGPGVRFQVYDNIQARVDYGLKLKQIHRLVDDSDSVGRFHVSATLAF